MVLSLVLTGGGRGGSMLLLAQDLQTAKRS